MKKNICFLGFGNMAKAIAHGLSNKLDLQLYATAPSLPIGTTPEGINTHVDNCAFVTEADVIIISVKPAKVIAVLNEIQSELSKNCVIVSIAAGVSLAKLAQTCPLTQPIVRCMPNTPIAIGKGATPLIANEFVNQSQKMLVETLFSYSGITTWLTNEQDMNTFTALTGSGPAYIFYFIEAMINTAEKMGLDKQLATAFIMQTFSGTLALLDKTGLSAADLRKKVTSPAGTTAAAIDIFQQQDFELLIHNAIKAAYERALQLDDNTRI